MTKEYKSLRTKDERVAFVERALDEERDRFNSARKRVEPHDPEYHEQTDLYICRQFALSAALSFHPQTKNQFHPKYQGALKPLDVAPNHQMPLRYTSIDGARGALVEEPFRDEDWMRNEIGHAINAVQVGDTGKSIDDWVFVEPQGLDIFRRNKHGGIEYSEMPTIIVVNRSVGHKRKYDGPDKYFFGDHLDSRVNFHRQGNRVEQEFLQAYGAKPINVTDYTDGPLPQLFGMYGGGTERWMATRGELDEFKKMASKIRVGRPTNGHKQHPDARISHQDGSNWYDVSPKNVIGHAKAFAQLGVVSPENFRFLKSVTKDPVLHRAFDRAIETPIDTNVLNYLLARTG
ncbi:MAG: hypothetical protein ACP5NS_04305 [Candidatus Pacearchaeota archaeon]